MKPPSLTALGYRRSAPKLDERRTGAWGTLILNANVAPVLQEKAKFRGGDATLKESMRTLITSIIKCLHFMRPRRLRLPCQEFEFTFN